MIERTIAGFAVWLAVAGCGGDEVAPLHDAGTAADDGATIRDSATPRDSATVRDDGSIPTVVRIVASEGGRVQSPDGVFTLAIPAGALAEDTDFSITIVPRDAWPASVASLDTFGELYDVQPDGIEFLEDATATWRYASVPELVHADGSFTLLGGHWHSAVDGTDGNLETDSFHEADGSLVVAARIPHLTEFVLFDWAATTGIELEGGERTVGTSWSATSARVELPGAREYANVAWAAGVVGHWDPPRESVVVMDPLPGSTVSRRARFDGDAYRWDQTYDHTEIFVGVVQGPAELTMSALPTFRCIGEGEDKIFISVRAQLGSDLTYSTGGSAVQSVRCVAPSGPEPGIGVLLADYCNAGRVGPTFACTSAASGAIANVIVPTAEIRSHLSPIGSTSVVFEGVESWASEVGPPELVLTTSSHEVTATHDGTAYTITGLGPGPVLAHPDELVVTGTPPLQSEVSVRVPSIDPATTYLTSAVLGDADGLSTRMGAQDGAFDAMYVHATATGSSSSGEAGVMRLVPASTMTLDTTTGRRSAPLLDDATIAALDARGLTVESVLVGPVRFVTNDALFPGLSVPVLAGRFVRIPASQLDAIPPAGECVPATADLTSSATSRVSLCYETSAMTCGMQLQERCTLSEWIGSFRDRAGPNFTFYTENDPPLPIRSATHGTIESAGILYNRVAGLPSDTDVTIQLDVTPLGIGADDVRFTFRRSGTTIEIVNFERVPPP